MFNEHDHQNKISENKDGKKNRRKSTVKGFLTTVTAGVIGSILTLGVAPQIAHIKENGTTQAIQEASAINNQQTHSTDTSLNVQQVSTSTADIIEKASKAIVGITNIQSARQNSFPSFYQNNSEASQELESGTGSGVIYKVTDNEIYIVTNNHVIEEATKIEVTLYNEDIVTAELVGADSLTDIALLKVTGNFNISPLTFGNSDMLRAGDDVIAIGNPLGLDLYGTVTQGIVSAINRTLDVSTSTGTWEMNVIQTDAAINPGNSGGALINTSGELVGINSMKIADDEVEGIGFAIPSNDVKTIIEELTENGQIIRPYLGVSMANLSEVPQFYLENIAGNLTEGVIITSLDESGTAAKAGLMAEDIIVSINREKITDADQLRKFLYTDLSVGDTITIEYYRQGELKKAEVTLISNQPSLNE
ncbi:S1C family serine protease [Bacillus dakarensis]|uniref:S1C family serine protease n=1 Tax=Robertmurraya dakarensis TaxID=1926278 RepID=UPI000981C25B|nr:trypsin-like peptidase domain-containing protein [Bacillus dakarensis]